MLLRESVRTQVSGTDYAIEYAITRNGEEEDPGEQEAYGIRCKLYESDVTIAQEEVTGITSEWDRVKKFVHILEKNLVFPAHLRDVLEDLLILEFEEKRIQVLT